MIKNYRIFGLNIASSIPLPAPEVTISALFDTPDVRIEYGEVANALPSPQTVIELQALSAWIRPGECLLHISGVAKYYTSGGSRIVVQPEPGAETERILIFLMGSVMGVLLHQRNLLVLHASAVMIDGSSVAFTGPSGIGKSTLAAGFYHRGYSVLSDDLCAISVEDAVPSVIPGFPRLKLWEEALKKLACDPRNLESVCWDQDLDKYYLPFDRQPLSPVPLKSIFVLEVGDVKTIEVIQLKGMKKIDALIMNTYRYVAVDGLDLKQEHFKQCTCVSQNVDVNRIIRPRDGFFLDELMDALEGPSCV